MNTIKSSKTLGILTLSAVWIYVIVRLIFTVWLTCMYDKGVYPETYAGYTRSPLFFLVALLFFGFIFIITLLFYLWIRRAYLNMEKQKIVFSYGLNKAFGEYIFFGWYFGKPLFVTIREILDGVDNLLQGEKKSEQERVTNISIKGKLIIAFMVICVVTIIPFNFTIYSPLCFTMVHTLFLIPISILVTRLLLKYMRAESELIRQLNH